MAAVYLGPSDFFGYKGNFYRRGESVPLSEAEIIHHVRSGHYFEGYDITAVGPAEVPVAADQPRDDRGAAIAPKGNPGSVSAAAVSSAKKE